ncbi:tRNA lysidine(34) synthetase TilS [Salinimonas marina]|uniref:tRNA(Ile)-lysidine synthase n=1 Tax=Salinimonas marina TaxID=2785918 RepID=A0A7S9DW05_9ALTE|nr:tRNA lysidine(34) synthetase TilS [Salinimonas marina]QPG04991.1 tRNA lysidine(34) synthetase TilS [Salinimonas marina]
MNTTISGIHRQLQQLLIQGPGQGPCGVQPLVIGFSGGLDSRVLLQAACSLPGVSPSHIHAVYIHHGLSEHADAWQLHCQQCCQQLGCQFVALPVSVSLASRTSTEASARDARYEALFEYCRQHQGTLALGQHLNDQLETFLLQAQRGAGPKGLAGMPALVHRQQVWIVRPLLEYAREQLEQCAKDLNLQWVEDESNQDTRFDRNFLRQHITPLLQQRWPVIGQTIARSARLCAQQTALLEEVCDERLAPLLAGCSPTTAKARAAADARPKIQFKLRQQGISLEGLSGYSEAWQEQLVRRWLEHQQQPMPEARQLSEILKLTRSSADAQPLIRLANKELRCFQRYLYLVSPLPEPGEPSTTVAPGQVFDEPWSVVAFSCSQQVQVTGNMPAAVCRMHKQGVSKKLKDWFKQWQVPAWRRRHIPVILENGVVVAVVLPDQPVLFTQADNSLTIAIEKR